MPSDNDAAAKSFRRSWADMNSDDSSMGVQLPSMTRRKDDHGSNPIQLSKSGKGGPNSFSVVCDDSYAPGMHSNENRRDVLNAAFQSVHIATDAPRSSGDNFSCFGFLLPKTDETFDGETRSRMAGSVHVSSDESKLGKRLLSAVGGQSDFSSMMHAQPSDSSHASKFRKIDEASADKMPTSFVSIDPLAPTRRTMTDGADKTKVLNSKRLQSNTLDTSSMMSTSVMSEDDNEWEARFRQREKQIEIGKNTKGYKAYGKKVNKDKRTLNDPQTPDSREMCSKRQFDGKMHKWRKGLHQYDDSMLS